jgi:hypothetical protein
MRTNPPRRRNVRKLSLCVQFMAKGALFRNVRGFTNRKVHVVLEASDPGSGVGPAKSVERLTTRFAGVRAISSQTSPWVLRGARERISTTRGELSARRSGILTQPAFTFRSWAGFQSRQRGSQTRPLERATPDPPPQEGSPSRSYHRQVD